MVLRGGGLKERGRYSEYLFTLFLYSNYCIIVFYFAIKKSSFTLCMTHTVGVCSFAKRLVVEPLGNVKCEEVIGKYAHCAQKQTFMELGVICQ